MKFEELKNFFEENSKKEERAVLEKKMFNALMKKRAEKRALLRKKKLEAVRREMALKKGLTSKVKQEPIRRRYFSSVVSERLRRPSMVRRPRSIESRPTIRPSMVRRPRSIESRSTIRPSIRRFERKNLLPSRSSFSLRRPASSRGLSPVLRLRLAEKLKRFSKRPVKSVSNTRLPTRFSVSESRFTAK